MNGSDTSIPVYDAQSAVLAERYDDPALLRIHDPILSLLSDQPAQSLALDIGAGSGRDAAWLSALGYEVVAVEPAAGMRAEAMRRHAEADIRWVDDRLPSLTRVHALGLAFDLIMVSAVWQHIAPSDRQRAFRKLTTLLKPSGLLVISLRRGKAPADRPMFDVSAGELEGLARLYGIEVLRELRSNDQMGREEVSWTHVVLRMPDDGAGALPLIRGIILGAEKSSTYKLALLRAVARVADVAPATARPILGEIDEVEIPLGLVALNWLRMYLPLVRAGLPQAPRNSGPDGLGFVKAGFRTLIDDRLSGIDLRPGASFSGERAVAVASAITDVASTIASMPANFTRFPGSDKRIFGAHRSRAPKVGPSLFLDVTALWQWGSLTVPGHVWRALTRLGAWIEPVLVTEWARLMRSYADRMGTIIAVGVAEAGLVWEEPQRDTQLARAVAIRIRDMGRPVCCIWTGRPVPEAQLDIDHCLPWSAWPCGDLWNLMPSTRRINQHQKRDYLPAKAALAAARPYIVDWWKSAWMDDPVLGLRFTREAAAALPLDEEPDVENIFAALEWRRLRLRQDQQVPEWSGVGVPL